MFVIKPVVNNIRDTKLIHYLKSKGVKKQDEDIDLSEWVEQLIREERVTEEEINKCVLNELVYGSRRLVRIYGLKNVRKIKREEDWETFLDEYNCPSLNFNKIITTALVGDDKIRVCAVSTEMEELVIKKIQIIFVYNMI